MNPARSPAPIAGKQWRIRSSYWAQSSNVQMSPVKGTADYRVAGGVKRQAEAAQEQHQKQATRAIEAQEAPPAAPANKPVGKRGSRKGKHEQRGAAPGRATFGAAPLHASQLQPCPCPHLAGSHPITSHTPLPSAAGTPGATPVRQLQCSRVNPVAQMQFMESRSPVQLLAASRTATRLMPTTRVCGPWLGSFPAGPPYNYQLPAAAATDTQPQLQYG
ncbi:hypothetical protein VOLCADRAFT_92730 [Volvox carteri f. nagariensis]|uniref:Uncharacterized protein n=1 Tax=Volvox carteri f. nagariensis TaxID=3068 RepID=D8U0D6_VOLCA|nr:uncharacterized protein VOLCADRAFT_92730 [Volvox carteri f. nagariensis]EFJ46842.1 hypothetical protein VOLCADRAFT_92730 [Volvox carteri f. nagariensis]|eukprot:XP_002952051.1 hypothetical protein VOLCADRAFT_92730 [Volvox carteri f. nagariensis]